MGREWSTRAANVLVEKEKYIIYTLSPTIALYLHLETINLYDTILLLYTREYLPAIYYYVVYIHYAITYCPPYLWSGKRCDYFGETCNPQRHGLGWSKSAAERAVAHDCTASYNHNGMVLYKIIKVK